MTPEEVLAKHTEGDNYNLPSEMGCCVACGQPWGEDGCDAVQMAKMAKRYEEQVSDATDALYVLNKVIADERAALAGEQP